MSDSNQEVKDIETVTLPESSSEHKPDDDELVEEPEKDSDDEKESSDQPEVKEPEPIVDGEKKEEPAPVDSETPREHALRLEVERLKGLRRQERKEDLQAIEQKVEKIEKKDVLSKYDQQELANLKEVMEVFAEEFGFVRKNEFQTQNYRQTADTILDDFLQAHVEYLPENDKDNLLWNRFKEEFSLYKQPDNPRDVKKILDRIHSSITGTGRSLNQNALKAQQEKVKQAAHGGTTIARASSDTKPNPVMRSILKGFSEEEMKDLEK